MGDDVFTKSRHAAPPPSIPGEAPFGVNRLPNRPEANQGGNDEEGGRVGEKIARIKPKGTATEHGRGEAGHERLSLDK